MDGKAFTLFDTPLGRCGVAWGGRGLAGVQLPESGEAETRARLRRRFEGAREGSPPPEVRRAIEAIVALLRGEPSGLSRLRLDMDGVPPFHRRVYEAARRIPAGETVSYGEIAARLGTPAAARAVGQALKRNPFPLVVPCHRVLAARGRVGGFTASGGTRTKLRILALETPSPAEARERDEDAPLGFDPDVATAHLAGCDAALARWIERVGPFRIELQDTPSVFGALAEAVVHQQLTTRAAATIFARVRALAPRARGHLTGRHLLRIADEKLRGAGLSGAKVLALRDLARREADGALPTLAQLRRMEDDTIVEKLTEVRGIGRWTAEMLLIFRLGRPDVLPLDDYGLRKGFQVAFRKRELPTRNALAQRGARWKPYRTVASWYLWRAAQSGGAPAPRSDQAKP